MDEGYELIDAGDGRRLERFGALRLDRPAAGASGVRRAPGLWAGALTFRAGRGWAAGDGGPATADASVVRLGGVTMLASLAGGGQVGVFPEHASNAAWVRAAIVRRQTLEAEPPSILNLFAYTGLLTLAAAAAGAAVTHVDASRPAVQWARRNAEANALDGRPIRWIVDDALAYLRREARRGRRYDGLILDPPSYGHGGDGGHAGAFRIDRDIEELLAAAIAVAMPTTFWLLSTHTIGWDGSRLVSTLGRALGIEPRQAEPLPLEIEASSGTRLRLGAAARFDPLDPDRR